MSQILSSGGGGGSGSVTSISAGTGITLTPNPITSTGTVALTIPVTVPDGGTGVQTMTTAYAPVCAGTTATGALQVASTGLSNSGYILTSTGSSSLPTFQAPAASSITITGDSGGGLTGSSFTFTASATGLTFAGAGTTETLGGTLNVGHGGTGAATLAANGIIYGNGTSAVGVTSAGTNGQVLIAATSAAPAFASLTSTGGTIVYTTGANSLNLDVAGGGTPWTDVTGTSQAMAVNNGYVADNSSLVTLTLPSTAAFGTIIKVAGKGAGGWTIAQNSGQTINFGNVATTTGVGGSLSSSNQYDQVDLLCVTTNTQFVVRYSVGNITYV